MICTARLLAVPSRERIFEITAAVEQRRDRIGIGKDARRHLRGRRVHTRKLCAERSAVFNAKTDSENQKERRGKSELKGLCRAAHVGSL